MSDAAKPPVTADAAAFAAARPPKQAAARSTPRLRRGADDAQPKGRETARKLVPAASSFDLLDGEYAKTRKSRLLSVLSLGVASVVVVLLAAQLLRVRLEIGSVEGRLEAAGMEASRVQADLDQLSQFGGVPGDMVDEAVISRARQAAIATELEVDAATVVAELTRGIPAGVVLTQIEIGAPVVPEAEDDKTADTTPAAEAAPTGGYVTVTVLAEVASYDAIGPFLDRLRLNPLLADLRETWEGKPPRLLLRVEVTVKMGQTDRYAEYATEAGIIAPDEEGS